MWLTRLNISKFINHTLHTLSKTSLVCHPTVPVGLLPHFCARSYPQVIFMKLWWVPWSGGIERTSFQLTCQKDVERTPEMSWIFMLKLCHVQNPPPFHPMCIQKVIFLNLVAAFKLYRRKLLLLEAPNTTMRA